MRVLDEKISSKYLIEFLQYLQRYNVFGIIDRSINVFKNYICPLSDDISLSNYE